MGKEIGIILKNEHLKLLPEKVIFWENKQALILTDLHLGKVGHFRKAGISIPPKVLSNDIGIIAQLLSKFSIKRLIVVGDMFHSSFNEDVAIFERWRKQHPYLNIDLAMGNHDVLGAACYNQLNITTHLNLKVGPFNFEHIPPSSFDKPTNKFTFYGHVHPGVKLQSKVRTGVSLPCFYIAEHYCLLPAFSAFTGLGIIKPKREDRVYVIANQNVVQVN